MNNSRGFIHHIGLQIVENDLQPFYKKVLSCIILREFILPKEEAFLIFNISNEVKIIYTQCENVELELFIDDKPKEASFNHVCIHTNRADEITNKAQTENFRVFIREKKDGTKTYFISDSNYNLFEIKRN
jgi:hypothetical protein